MLYKMPNDLEEAIKSDRDVLKCNVEALKGNDDDSKGDRKVFKIN